ncbi:uncharacterized protein LOC143453374 [Clavelina lepadiformis]|uniref:uncharacterized protein LOC143453374 n=1 Tax=Clavelina lepadiformis TaxID=159417 RepID=UPI0040420164
MASIQTMLGSTTTEDSKKSIENESQPCALNGDDSLCNGSDSATSTSSPTSSITSSGSASTETDEGVFVKRRDCATSSPGSGALKKLEEITLKLMKPVDDDSPLDLSCPKKRATPREINPMTSSASETANQFVNERKKIVVKTELLDDSSEDASATFYFPNNVKSSDSIARSPREAVTSSRDTVMSSRDAATSSRDRATSSRDAATSLEVKHQAAAQSFLPVSFSYATSMLPWPYLMPPISSTVGVFPTIPPTPPGAKYFHPGFLYPQVGKPVVPSKLIPSKMTKSEWTDHSYSTFKNSGFNHELPNSVGLTQYVSQMKAASNVESGGGKANNFDFKSFPPDSKPNSSVQKDSALFAEFSRIFGAHSSHLPTTCHRKGPSQHPDSGKDPPLKSGKEKSKQKIGKLTRESTSSYRNAFDTSSLSASFFRDLPTMVASERSPNVFAGAGKCISSKRRLSEEDFRTTASHKLTSSEKKSHKDFYGNHVTPQTWNEPSSSAAYQGEEKLNDIKQPRPVNFKPCRIPCKACGRTYATVGALAKHAKIHKNPNSDNKFNCKICKKECSSLGALRMHIRTHTLPCECHICGKAFSRTWLLQGHIRTHTGEKPYQCTVCSRAFADRSNLRAHMQTHETVKRYSCESCDKTFSRISLLKRHQANCNHVPEALSGNQDEV